MIAPDTEVLAVLRQFNPWWLEEPIPNLPSWRRAAFHGLREWAKTPPAGRSLLLNGARQVGKTTLFLQTIDQLLKDGVHPNNIFYATLDHPLLKLVGLDKLLQLWRDIQAQADGPEYLFLDEIQAKKDWQTWLKHQFDFEKRRRIAVTGSAMPLATEHQESGVGRWQTIRLATLSFFEFLQIRNVKVPPIPDVKTLRNLLSWPPSQFSKVSAIARPLTAHFHDYLIRGGFPQCALVATERLAQKLLHEDIVDRVLKRDMTAVYGVRRIVELELTFLYLCLHDGGVLDLTALCQNLQLKKPTVSSFIDVLEASHLIHRLRPFGYGKEVLRGRPKVYLADAAIAPSVLLRGHALLEDEASLGRAVETAFFKHVFTRYYQQSVAFSYWRGKRDHEVDMIAEIEGRLVPFEVKYRKHTAGVAGAPGLAEFCEQRKVDLGYLITKDMDDFDVIALGGKAAAKVIRIPAPLATYWLGASEIAAMPHEAAS